MDHEDNEPLWCFVPPTSAQDFGLLVDLEMMASEDEDDLARDGAPPDNEPRD